MYLLSNVTNSGHCMVLIDAAKGCATEGLDLSQYPADFVVISFYKVHMNAIWLSQIINSYIGTDVYFLCFLFFLGIKLFGYPTGLGALLARNGKQFV